jgi:hypothetical protein
MTLAVSRAPTGRRLLASPLIVSSLVPFDGLLPSSHVSDASRIDYSKTLTCSAEEKDGGGPQ